MTMLIAFSGSRDWSIRGDVLRALKAHYEPGCTLVVGDAEGADALATEIWRRYVGEPIIVRAQWATFGKAAGPLRNQAIMDNWPDILVAVMYRPSTVGTQDMINRATAMDIPIHLTTRGR
jgi:hypothetical protein